MSSAGNQEFELDEAFLDTEALPVSETSRSGSNSKASLLKRRLIDDILQEKRLQSHLKEYDFDLEDD
ncbi:PA3496 family putative envelope integrity protein [Aquirhabdus sp.]|uniref:PA3496 family putative envelope integrity protein n=1 Tax=Aquirhabdus sp. TaxID=2824160 RepID=UPI00396C721C